MEFLPCIIRTNSFCSVTIRFCAVYICEKLLHSLKALFLVRRGKLERKMASLCPAGYCQKVRKERIESIYLLTTSNKLVEFQVGKRSSLLYVSIPQKLQHDSWTFLTSLLFLYLKAIIFYFKFISPLHYYIMFDVLVGLWSFMMASEKYSHGFQLISRGSCRLLQAEQTPVVWMN